MYRRFAIITLALLAFLTAGAQNGVNAPYSQYGFSQTSLPNTTPFAASMGGIVTTRSGYNYVNPFNPASYASIQGESFVFDISMSLVSSRLSDASQSMRDFDGGLTSISIAFPIFDWWKTSLGLLPYSSTLYESVLIGDVGMGTQQVKTIYEDRIHHRKESRLYMDFDPEKNWKMEVLVEDNRIISVRKRKISYYPADN